MRLRPIAVILAFLLLTTAASADLLRTVPDAIAPGEPATITLQLSGATAGQRVIVSEMLPDGASIGVWSVDGALEPVDQISLVQDGSSFIWEFTAAREDPLITYALTVPTSEPVTFDAVYVTSPTEFGRVTGEITPPSVPAAPSVPDAAPATPATPAPESSLAQSEPGLGLPIIAIYFVLLGALAYLLVRIRQHAPARTHRGVSHALSHHVSRALTAIGRGGARFSQHAEHAARHLTPATTPVPAAHHTPAGSQQVVHHVQPAAAPVAEPAAHHVSAQHAPAAAPAPVESRAPDLDRFDRRYEQVLKRIDAYEKLAKEDEAVVDLLESLKEELRSISFEYHELRGNQRVPA